MKFSTRLPQVQPSGAFDATSPTLKDAPGAPPLVLHAREMTGHKQTEAALRLSEARTRAIIESSLDCVIAMDHTGRIVEFNPAAEKTFGYIRAEVLGRCMTDLIIPPALRHHHHAAFADYLKTGESHTVGRRIETVAMRRDGSEFPAELAVSRLAFEGEPHFTACLRDITEQKRSEEQIREQAALLDKAQDAILVRDLTHRILYWNKSAERLFGWTADEVLGRNSIELNCRQDGATFLEALQYVLEKGEWSGELRQTTKSGAEGVVENR